MKFLAGLRGAAVGAVPGLVLVLLAQFVIKGEMQLTVGAPGIVLAVVGVVVGFAIGWSRATRTTS